MREKIKFDFLFLKHPLYVLIYEEQIIFALKESGLIQRTNKKRKEKRRNYMNKTILMGRLTKDPEVKYLQNENNTAMARYTLAVDRRYRKDGKAETDFISCVTFGKNAEFAEKYLKKGLKILVSGRIQTGSYVNQEGNKVYATNVIVEEHYFAEGKKLSGSEKKEDTDPDGFMHLPDGEELPFE